MPALPPLYILRHGQTEWNAEGRLQGRLDSPLTAAGRAQAAAQGRLLRGVFAAHPDLEVWTSPAGRARETLRLALAVCDRAGAPVQLDPDLQEVDLGDWTGRLMSEIGPEVPGTPGALGWTVQAPGGEGQEALRARAAGVLARLRGPSVLVTHGVTSLALRGQARGLDDGAMAALRHEHGVIYALRDGQERVLRAEDAGA